MINREEYLKRLRKLSESNDFEATHSEADNLLVEILMKLGMDDIAKAYENVGKWYA